MRWLVVWAAVLSGIAVAAPLPPSPSPRYVHDDAGWLGAHVFTELDLKLEKFERETSSQVVVGIFPKLPEREELADYSQRLFDAWMPGQKGKDNGVLLLVFAENRMIRIHVGYGMEGALPDILAGQIIRNEMAPKLRAGDREGAIEAGVDAILAATKGEYRGDGRTNLDRETKEISGVWIVVFVVAFLLLGWRFPILFQVAEVIFSGAGSTRSSGGGWTSGGGSFGGGWSSGGGGFSGRGGGGFSGGGGRSGGGGASGGW